jgi:cytochrome P450
MLKEAPSGVRMADGSVFGGINLTGGPSQFILRQDPPDHTRLRKLMNQAFTPRAVQRMREHVNEIVDRQLDSVAAAGEMDVIADLALPVPSTVICEMMGVSIADRDKFTQWTAAATHLLAAALAPHDVIERGVSAAQSLATYFTDLIEIRRKSLGDDILSGLIRAEEQGDRLSSSELIAQSIGLLIAGFETTIGLIGNGVRALIQHPDQLALLQERPDLIAGAVEECLRFDGPIILTIRVTREDTHFGDRMIPRDRPVMCLLASANRDPEHFDKPDRFDITRRRSLRLRRRRALRLGAHLARLRRKPRGWSAASRTSSW